MIKNLLFHIEEIFNFYLKSISIYEVHSPLVFKILNAKAKRRDILDNDRNKSWWKSLKKQKSLIHEADPGSGSKSRRHDSIARAAKIASSSNAKSRRVASIIAATQCKCVLELGSNLGKTTALIAEYNPEARVHSVEARSTLTDLARDYIAFNELSNVQIHNCLFADFIDSERNIMNQCDFIFLDGDHSYEASLRLTQKLLRPNNRPDFILIDDIRLNPAMKQFWDEIKCLDSVRVSIDLYSMGLLILKDIFEAKQDIMLIHTAFKPWRAGFFAPEIKAH